MALGTEIALIKALGGGGSSLPTVTSADAGKVLGVNDSGVWGASDRYALFYADVDADGVISTGDGNTLSMSKVSRFVASGYNFACDFTIGQIWFRAVVRPIQVDTYTVTFKGEYVDYINEERYDILLECSDDDESHLLMLTGKVTPLSDFIVTLTPTAVDYSGTMDKTVAEIDAAYKAGRKVVFAIGVGTDSYTFDCTMRYSDADYVYPSYNAYTVMNGNLILAWTGTTDDGDKITYGTSIYPLTPAT